MKKLVIEKGVIKKIYEMDINGEKKYSVELELESQYMKQRSILRTGIMEMNSSDIINLVQKIEEKKLKGILVSFI